MAVDSVYLKYNDVVQEFDHPLRQEDTRMIESFFGITLKGIKDGNKIKAIDKLKKGKTYIVEGISTPTTETTTKFAGFRAESLRNQGEGILLRDDVLTLRKETCQKILDQLNECNVLLVRSPPSSGKTSLGQLLKHYCETQSLECRWVSLLEIYDEESFEKFFKRMEGISFQKVRKSDSSSVIIIDETQMLYSKAKDPLWRALKSLQQGEVTVKVVCFASYGEKIEGGTAGTPIEFKVAFSLSDVRFTSGELEELFSSANSAVEAGKVRGVPLSEAVQKVIEHATMGHPGLTVDMIQSIWTTFSPLAERKRQVTDEDIVKYLMSNSYVGSLRTRAVPDDLGENQAALLSVLANGGQIDTPEPTDRAWNLVRQGILWQDAAQHKIVFSAPLVEMVYLMRLYRSTSETKYFPQDPKEFAKACIAGMDPQKLSASKSVSADGTRLERAWQMEFYRVASAMLPRTHTVSPDVGRTFGSDGYMDFYINGNLQWGFELLRDGRGVKQHASRRNEIYANIVKKLNFFLCIDFRFKNVYRNKAQKDVWYVIFSDETYTSARVVRKDEEDFEIRLEGGDPSGKFKEAIKDSEENMDPKTEQSDEEVSAPAISKRNRDTSSSEEDDEEEVKTKKTKKTKKVKARTLKRS